MGTALSGGGEDSEHAGFGFLEVSEILPIRCDSTLETTTIHETIGAILIK